MQDVEIGGRGGGAGNNQSMGNHGKPLSSAVGVVVVAAAVCGRGRVEGRGICDNAFLTTGTSKHARSL